MKGINCVKLSSLSSFSRSDETFNILLEIRVCAFRKQVLSYLLKFNCFFHYSPISHLFEINKSRQFGRSFVGKWLIVSSIKPSKFDIFMCFSSILDKLFVFSLNSSIFMTQRVIKKNKSICIRLKNLLFQVSADELGTKLGLFIF